MTSGGFDPNKDPQNPGGYPPPNQGSYPPPQGNYPPPQGNYPPPQGNFPPPQGNYPPPQQPYQGGGYPTPPPAFDSSFGQGQQLTVGGAISYGWRKFTQNALTWVLLLLAIALVQSILNFALRSDQLVLSFVFTVIVTVVGYLMQAALTRGALHELDGNKPSFGAFFQFSNVGAIILAGLLIGVLSTLGFVLLIIPGIVVVFFTWWTFDFVIDRSEDPISALKSSGKAIASNVGTILVLALALVALNVVGALLLLVGLLVTVPVSVLASTYAYRVTVGGRVS